MPKENMFSRGNPITPEYRENHDKIFGKPEKEPVCSDNADTEKAEFKWPVKT